MTQARPNLLVIRSADIDRAVTFYQALGLAFVKHAHGTGPEHFACELADFVFEIYPLDDQMPATTSTRLGFKVNHTDETVDALRTLGATIICEASDSPWGRRAVVDDFDGHRVELSS